MKDYIINKKIIQKMFLIGENRHNIYPRLVFL